MSDITRELVAELNTLAHLTRTETALANARRAQAADDRVERELARNAENADRRAERLEQAVLDLGGVPDTVGAVFGRLTAAARLPFDQVVPVREALLGDLRLEHELRDRARFARVLAETADHRGLTRTLESIERAHDETIDWIERRLGEVAVGGPSVIRPTATQVVAKVGESVAMFPARAAVGSVNRSVQLFGEAQERAGRVVEENVDRTRQIVEALSVGITAARNVFLGKVEEQARKDGARQTADNMHRLRADAGALDAGELPIPRYESLTVSEVSDRIARLQDPADVRAVLAYEEANKARKGVTQAAQGQLDSLVADLIDQNV